MIRLVLLAALVSLTGCDAPMYALGDPAYETATLCTMAELTPFLQDAADRWHAAAPRVTLSVRVVADPASPDSDPACTANVYTDQRVATELDDLGVTVPGTIIVTGGDAFLSDASDILAHEVGHLLLGDNAHAHSIDSESVMHPVSHTGEQSITPADVARLP